MRLCEISPSKNKKDKFDLVFSNGEKLVCTAAQVADFALYGEKELTESEYAALKDSAELSAAKERAAALLAYRPMSRGELERKLIEKGESAENARAAAEWLCDIGVINELEYAKSIVRHYSAKGWGAGRIREEFYSRRVPREYWEDALEELCGEDERIERFIERRLASRGNDPKELKKAADALYRRGFSWQQIKNAVERYSKESYEDEC